jgi:transglutaminase-like putative cysteine protease
MVFLRYYLPMKLAVGCHLKFEAVEPTPLILMLKPRSGDSQWVLRETYLLEPFVPTREYTDVHGNLCQRLITPVGAFDIRTEAWVETSDTIAVAPGAPMTAIEFLPDWLLQFLLPSRYCQSDQLFDLATEISADYWYTFDATQVEPRGNRIVIAYGRDAADVALTTQFGCLGCLNLTRMEVWVKQVNSMLGS